MSLSSTRTVCFVLIMSMLILSGCASTGEQNASGTQKAPPPTALEKKALPMVPGGKVNSLSYNYWDSKVNIYRTGQPEESVRTTLAILRLEGGRAVLSLDDRRMLFTIGTGMSQEATEESSLASIEFKGIPRNVTLKFRGGGKEKLWAPKGIIQVQFNPGLDLIKIRKQHDGLRWERSFRHLP